MQVPTSHSGQLALWYLGKTGATLEGLLIQFSQNLPGQNYFIFFGRGKSGVSLKEVKQLLKSYYFCSQIGLLII